MNINLDYYKYIKLLFILLYFINKFYLIGYLYSNNY